MPIIPLPHVPWYLRPLLWLTRTVTGKDPLPARLLTAFPKAAFGVGVFEACAASAPHDLDARTLAVARIVASVTAGCPFCVDMNAATWSRAGLTATDLETLFDPERASAATLGPRAATAAAYARALSLTPIVLSAELLAALQANFDAREVVVLATTIAQVNYWSRFNQGLGIPAAGFFDQSVCQMPSHLR